MKKKTDGTKPGLRTITAKEVIDRTRKACEKEGCMTAFIQLIKEAGLEKYLTIADYRKARKE